MFTIGICDDEPAFLEHIFHMTDDVLSAHSIPFNIHTFGNCGELAGFLETANPSLDLLLLDILVEEENGVSFAEQLRRSGNELPILFITSTLDFVLEGYTVEPVGYLLKPVEQSKLEEALLRAYRKKQTQSVVLQTASNTVNFRLDDILYAEVYDKKLHIHLADNRTVEVSGSLSSLAEKLPSDRFIQCHRSYMVSLPSIRSIWRYSIELSSHEQIPVSKSHYKAVQRALLMWAENNR